METLESLDFSHLAGLFWNAILRNALVLTVIILIIAIVVIFCCKRIERRKNRAQEKPM